MIYFDIHSFRVECDIDGWTLRVNNEDSYETFYHLEGIAIEDIVSVEIIGDALISYTGFGDKGENSTEIFLLKH